MASNTTYTLSFWLQAEGGFGGPSVNSFSAQVGGVVGGTQTVAQQTNSAPFAYKQYTLDFTTIGASADLTFSFKNNPSYWFLDDIVVVSCTQTISGSVPSVSTGSGTTCIDGATVNGAAKVNPGTKAGITNSTIGGATTATNPKGFVLCGSTTSSSVAVSGSTGFVLIGDPGDDACAGNSVGGPLTLKNNTGGVEVSHNSRIGGSVILTGHGSGPFLPDDANPEVEANRIFGALSCSGSSAVVNDGLNNTVSGGRAGQCAGF